MINKRLALTIGIIFMISSLDIFCQSLIGIYAGYNQSSFYSNSSSSPHYSGDYDSKPSFIMGFHMKERKDKMVNLALSFDYLKRNVSIDANYGGLGGSIDRYIESDIHTINLRILPEFRFGSKMGLYLNCGPYIGYIISSIHQIDSSRIQMVTGEYSSWSATNKQSDEFYGFDIGITASVGIEVPLFENFMILTDINISRGINSLIKGSLNSYSGKFNATNLYFTFGVVYKLNRFNLSDGLKKL